MKENMYKLGNMDIKKLIIKMALPAMLSMFVQALYNIVDSIFVAKISVQALTALSIAFPIQLIIVSIFVGLGVGINSFMSRKLGSGNKDVARNTAEHGFAIGIVLWIILAICSTFVPKMFTKMFTDDPVVIKYAVQYTSIIMLFSFGSIISEVCMNILRSTGDMLSSMRIQLLGAITNIILDPILIFGLLFFPKLSVQGAAIATVIGQILAMIYALKLVLRNNNGLKLNLKKFHYSSNITGEIFKVGVPAMFMQLLGSVMVSGINLILAGFSGTAVAVFGIYYKLQSFIYMPVFGLTQGIMPIVGYNYGAKNKQRVLEAVKYGCIFACAIMLFGTSLFVIFPGQLLMLFSSTSQMNAIGIKCLRIISIGFVFSGIAIVLSTVFQAFGKAKVSLIISFARQIIILLPLTFILSKLIGLTGVWIAFPISEAASLIISGYFAIKVYREKIRDLEGEIQVDSNCDLVEEV
ncbi:MATE family efflux transporter [Clostridium bowmanii]|uniref:MATE family efflux transporter n=1 Tax=Clostridium bowmanii TaxID=132925 RepID=UPI001C0C405E|nr:MATE family efflux transporter [Clostridium bowmanii]MBU3191372.1 MATE family efflux transporter [Clostridium bowmanii]MCA1075783.1 MATE family efflux transporter [Clostridium bowmanii]